MIFVLNRKRKFIKGGKTSMGEDNTSLQEGSKTTKI